MPPHARIVPIIGGGPAGMSCALWLHNYGLRPVIIEQEAELGGMARHSPYRNEWLLGRPDETARENAAAFAGHIRKLPVEARLGARPQRLRRERGGGFRLDLPSPGRGRSFGNSAAHLCRQRPAAHPCGVGLGHAQGPVDPGGRYPRSRGRSAHGGGR